MCHLIDIVTVQGHPKKMSHRQVWPDVKQEQQEPTELEAGCGISTDRVQLWGMCSASMRSQARSDRIWTVCVCWAVPGSRWMMVAPH